MTEPLGWQNSTLINGDVAERVTQLKAEDGDDILVIGSGELVATLARRDLVAEYRLMIHPIVMGTGKRLFGAAERPTRLRVTDSKTSSTGVLVVTYVPGDQ